MQYKLKTPEHLLPNLTFAAQKNVEEGYTVEVCDATKAA